MKQDRFLLSILIAIAALVIIAIGTFFTRQDQQEYMEENTPKGVVHDYALAVIKGDYKKAYSFLAEAERKPSYEAFRQAFFSHYVDPSNAGLEIGETKIEGDSAYVTISLIYKPTDPFSSIYRNSEVARLERQNGSWKLLQMPYNYWAYEWYQPTPKPIY